MNDAERMRILELLEQGKITAAEAADLLSALDERPREGGQGERSRPRERHRWRDAEFPADRPRWFRVRVTDAVTGRTRTNVSVPLGMVGFGLGFAHRFKVPGGSQVDAIVEAIRAGRRGTVFDVSSDDSGERVEIIIE